MPANELGVPKVVPTAAVKKLVRHAIFMRRAAGAMHGRVCAALKNLRPSSGWPHALHCPHLAAFTESDPDPCEASERDQNFGFEASRSRFRDQNIVRNLANADFAIDVGEAFVFLP